MLQRAAAAKKLTTVPGPPARTAAIQSPRWGQESGPDDRVDTAVHGVEPSLVHPVLKRSTSNGKH
jgi:hypothetical protein